MSTRFLYVSAFIASILLSWWISARETVINPDAICYLYSAEEFGKSTFYAAMHLCPQAKWPFYSALIYGLVKFTHLSYTTAAFVLDGCFTAISVVTFIAIVKALGGSRRVVWMAAAVILLAHEFNNVRQHIIRDHGFWAFYLMSVWILLRYFAQPSWWRAIGFSLSLVLATLFRIEGAIFLALLPFSCWFEIDKSWLHRTKQFFELNSVLIICLLGFAGWFLLHPHPSLDHANKLGRVGEIITQIQHGLSFVLYQFQSTKAAVLHSVLSHASARDAGIVVFLTLIFWYLINVINNLSWVYALLVVYAWWGKTSRITKIGSLVLVSYVVINLIVTASFFAQNLFLAKRYLIAMSLIFMLWVPFALEKLLELRSRVFVYIALVCILLNSLGGIFHFGHSKDYIRQAGDWLDIYVPDTATIYINDYQLMYYSNHFGSGIFKKVEPYSDVNMIANGKWKKYDYLALRVSKAKDDKVAVVMQEIHLRPVQVFVNDSGDRVFIYKVSHGE